jgi:hypothetical protein
MEAAHGGKDGFAQWTPAREPGLAMALSAV